MDNVTHALAGSLLAAATCAFIERRAGGSSTETFRRVAWTLGIVMAELPDADLLYAGSASGMGKLGYLLHHRGHTHTIPFVLLSAVAVWGIALLLRPTLRAPRQASALLSLSVVASLSHILLDYTNSYGVHPWWPVVNRWFYGDAVFIVEPCLWIVAIPPLLLTVRATGWRVLFGALLVVILFASWRVDMVGRGVAAALTVGALAWLGITKATSAGGRVMLGLAGWVLVEGVFFSSSAAARQIVRRDVGVALTDAVLSPSPGNPLCYSALVVSEQEGIYAATDAVVAPWPALRSVEGCGGGRRGSRRKSGERVGSLHDSSAIRWGERWSAPISQLRELAANNCEVAAALGFMRVPAWRRAPNGDITLFDLRFGEGGFASIVARPEAPCPRWVPNWEWPRSEVRSSR